MSACRRIWLVALVAVVLAACVSGSTTGPSSEQPSGSSAPSAPERGSLPGGCQSIDLRGPSGERVDLTGAWAGTGELAGGDETAWLNQLGDCLYGAVISGDPGSLDRGESITNLSGRIGSDFRIAFEIVIVAQFDVFAFGEYSTMEMLIEWDDQGRLQLREDRQPGEIAGRCIQVQFGCPAPLIWYRVDDAPPP